MTNHATVSVAKAAKVLGVSDATIRRAIHSGELKAAKVGGWRISLIDLEAFYRSRGGGDLGLADLEEERGQQ